MFCDQMDHHVQEEFGFLCLCELCSSIRDVTSDDQKRKRVLEIEVAWGELGGQDMQTAMELGEEQFKLCSELSFQPGLMSYVALHCVEAASLQGGPPGCTPTFVDVKLKVAF